MNDILGKIYREVPATELQEMLQNRAVALRYIQSVLTENLSLQELNHVVQHLQLTESWFSDFFRNVWQALLGVVPQMYNYLLSWTRPSDLVAKVDSRMAEFRVVAQKIMQEQNLNVTPSDVREFIVRTEQTLPRPTDSVLQHVAAKEPLGTVEYVAPRFLSVEEFVNKWVLLFIFYNLFLVMIGGAGLLWSFAPGFLKLFSVNATHIPLLYLAMADLLANLRDKVLVR